MTEFTISTDIETSEYTRLTEVWETSVRATHHFLTEADICFYKPLILNEYLKAVTLCAIRNPDGLIIAFMGVSGQQIEMLFIHPDARGKGYGKKLVAYALEQWRVTGVDVNEQNEQAVGFYLHIGCRATGRSATDSMGKPYPILHLQLPDSL